MIRCRTKGMPMREGTRVDAEGFHVFNLDEREHDPFAIMDRLWTAAGAVEDHAANARFDAMMKEKRQRQANQRRQR